jgi:predicted SnoaL-like aldol condensation-catalyzing enzyme
MKLNVLLSIVSVASAASYCPSRAATSTEQISICNEFVQKFYYAKNIRAAFVDHFSPNWIEHAPTAPPGTLNQTIDALTALAAISNFTVFHTRIYNNTSWVHLRQDTRGSTPVAIADIFQFNGSCIVEYWDITQERPANPVNPLALWSP